MDGEQGAGEGPAPVEPAYDAASDCVVANGLRVPADLFRDAIFRHKDRFFALAPIGSGNVELIEVEIKVGVGIQPKQAGQIVAPTQQKPKVMLPTRVAQQIAQERGIAAQGIP